MPEKPQKPAIDGWFTMDHAAPRLLGGQCRGCGTYVFPKQVVCCPNPTCSETDLEEIELSDRGTLWSFTDNHYAPPYPYMAPDPFEPYGVAAVTLEREQLVVLGQLAEGVQLTDLEAGMSMKLVLERLFEDEENVFWVWKWRPTDV
jgi:uncharacterized OB-fold protein